MASWVRFPVGRDAAAWRSVPTERVVLAVVHTLAGIGHVLDAVELVEGDPRVQVVFTQAPDLFSHGVAEHLDRLGAVVLSWRQATQTRFDLAVAADCAGLPELGGPILMLSHGVAYNKISPSALSGPGTDLVVGLGAPWLTWYGRLIPAAVLLPHEDLVPVLAEQCPQAVPAATVVGDLCLDRLTASAPGRAAYRAALGAAPGQPVLAISTTWGAGSLFADSWRLVRELLAGLPADAYAVRIVMHPALWYGHGPRQVLGWLRHLRQSGLRAVEPTSWRGLVAGADVLVGDHGSVTTYAAAAGVPVLRVPASANLVAPGSATEILAGLVPTLTPHHTLAAQLRAAVPAGRRAAGPVAAAVSSRPGRAAPLSRTEMYRLLALTEPTDDCAVEPVGPAVLIDW